MSVTVNPNVIILTDTVVAASVLNNITADPTTGALTANSQKILIDQTDNSQENDGNPTALALSASAVAAIMQIVGQEQDNADSGAPASTYAVTVTPGTVTN